MIPNLLREYLSFSHKERVAVMVLVLLAGGTFSVPWLLSGKNPSALPVEVARLESITKPVQKIADSSWDQMKNHQAFSGQAFQSEQAPELFPFNPNSISPEGWKRLGLREKTIGTIQHYLAKGGQFYRAEDLKKIYGIRPAEYERLLPYIRLPKEQKFASSMEDNKAIVAGHAVPAGKPTRPETTEHSTSGWGHASYNARTAYHAQGAAKTTRALVVDLNSADTAMLIALPGIGSKLAQRIVLFRDRLGGFYSIDQLHDVYGLRDSTFEMIRPFLRLTNDQVARLDLNMLEAAELKQHPYFTWTIANAIVQYRQQHGNFRRREDLLSIAAITPEIFKKIFPYCRID